MKANHTNKKRSILHLVQTKARELADYSGVNTPLNIVCWCCYGYHGTFLPITEWKPISARTRLKELWNQHNNIIINNNSAPAINHCERTVKQQKYYREGEILPYSHSEWGWTLENQEHALEQVPKVFGSNGSYSTKTFTTLLFCGIFCSQFTSEVTYTWINKVSLMALMVASRTFNIVLLPFHSTNGCLYTPWMLKVRMLQILHGNFIFKSVVEKNFFRLIN